MAAADQVQFDMGDEDCETEDEDGNRRPRRSTVRSAANRSSLCQNYEALDATTNKNFSMGDDDEDEDDGGTSTAKRSSLVDRYGALESFAATGTTGQDEPDSGKGARIEDVPSTTSPQDPTDADVQKRDEGGEQRQAEAVTFDMMEDECDTEDEDGNRKPRRSTISAAQRSSLCQHYEALEGASKQSFSMADGDEEEVGNAAAQRSSICARYAAMSDFTGQQEALQSEDGAATAKPELDPTVSGAPREVEEAVEIKTVTFSEPGEETAPVASSVDALAGKESGVVEAASTDAVQEAKAKAPGADTTAEVPTAVSAASEADSGSKVLSSAPQQECSTGEPQQVTQFDMMEDECDTEDEDGNRRTRRSTISAAQRSSLCQHYEALEGASKQSFSMGDDEEEGSATAQRSSICARYAALSDFTAQQGGNREAPAEPLDPAESKEACEAVETALSETAVISGGPKEGAGEAASQDAAAAVQASSVDATVGEETGAARAEAEAASTAAVQVAPEIESKEQQQAAQGSEQAAKLVAEDAHTATEEVTDKGSTPDMGCQTPAEPLPSVAPEAPAPTVEATAEVEKPPQIAPSTSKPLEKAAVDSASGQAAVTSAAPVQQPPPLLRCCLL